MANCRCGASVMSEGGVGKVLRAGAECSFFVLYFGGLLERVATSTSSV